MAGFEKRAKRYPTDPTDEEWAFIQPFLPTVSKCGGKPATDLRDVLDALRYPQFLFQRRALRDDQSAAHPGGADRSERAHERPGNSLLTVVSVE